MHHEMGLKNYAKITDEPTSQFNKTTTDFRSRSSTVHIALSISSSSSYENKTWKLLERYCKGSNMSQLTGLWLGTDSDLDFRYFLWQGNIMCNILKSSQTQILRSLVSVRSDRGRFPGIFQLFLWMNCLFRGRVRRETTIKSWNIRAQV